MSESKMQLWECTYKLFAQGEWVSDKLYKFTVKDWIWSTSKPTESAVGHYWKSLFGYEVFDSVVILADLEEVKKYTDKDGNLKFQIIEE